MGVKVKSYKRKGKMVKAYMRGQHPNSRKNLHPAKKKGVPTVDPLEEDKFLKVQEEKMGADPKWSQKPVRKKGAMKAPNASKAESDTEYQARLAAMKTKKKPAIKITSQKDRQMAAQVKNSRAKENAYDKMHGTGGSDNDEPKKKFKSSWGTKLRRVEKKFKKKQPSSAEELWHTIVHGAKHIKHHGKHLKHISHAAAGHGH